jgi:hypothetical protein
VCGHLSFFEDSVLQRNTSNFKMFFHELSSLSETLTDPNEKVQSASVFNVVQEIVSKGHRAVENSLKSTCIGLHRKQGEVHTM